MSINVGIVDYGLGNLFSINQACEYVGMKPVITADLQILAEADALILPGVGAFEDAMKNLHDNNLVEPLLEFVKSGRPFLGICLGMQLLFSESEEFGTHKGLNLIKGRVVRFPSANSHGKINKVPQIQWNQIYKNTDEIWHNSPLRDIEDNSYMQFVHSYYTVPEDRNNVLSYTSYGGISYASSVIQDNLVGFQFHPEKSGSLGLEIYKTWSEYIKNKSY
jgi:glutamine amidotransferase